MMRAFTLVGTAVALGLLSYAFLTRPSGVVAGTAVRMDVAELTEGAELIFEGRVLSAASFEVDGRIETEYLLQVERTFEGDDQPYRAVRIPGGVLEDGRGMVLAGMPRIRQGEETLLFLSREGSTGVRMPVGLAQGKFTIARSPSGATTLRRDMAGVALVSGSGALAQVEGATILDYAEVVAQIEAALATRQER